MEDSIYLGFFFSVAKLQIKAKPWENNLDFIINVVVQTFVYERGFVGGMCNNWSEKLFHLCILLPSLRGRGWGWGFFYMFYLSA